MPTASTRRDLDGERFRLFEVAERCESTGEFKVEHL
jgi:hypothetical protein